MRVENDFYPTPVSIMSVLLRNVEWPVEVVWEPCRGDGRLVAALQAKGYRVVSGDIDSGVDFFAQPRALSSTLITNPPFKDIRRFIAHAFSIGVERMALVGPERLWACKKGFDQFQRHRPVKFINLNWREDYLNRGGSPDRALAISIWEGPNAKSCEFQVWEKTKSTTQESSS